MFKKEWTVAWGLEIKYLEKYYKKIGYKILYNKELIKIKRLFKNKTTVFTGQTGSGKSGKVSLWKWYLGQ